MAGGFKIADAFVEISADKDQLRRDVEQLPSDLGPSTERAGRDIGKRLGKGIGDGADGKTVGRKVTDDIGAGAAPGAGTQGRTVGGRFADAFRDRVRGALDALPDAKVQLDDQAAQSKLLGIRRALTELADKRIGVDISSADAVTGLQNLRRLLSEVERDSKSVSIRADTAAASAEIDRFLASTVAKSDVAGKAAGDKVSQGMSRAVSSNSALIQAAIVGVLAAGAGAVTAGATLLFGGIGVVAAAQSERVQKAWGDTWNTVVSGTKADASVMESSLVGMANRVSAGFEQLRPALQGIFTAVGPQLESFTDDLMQAAQNAMPGFLTAVQNAGPVMTGLGNLVKSLGTGIGDFFGDLSQYAPQAGQVFTQLGRAVEAVLPALSTLIGAGTEVAAGILPSITSALGGLSNVVQFVAPILPAVGDGLLGFKVGNMAAGWLGKAAGALGGLGDAMGGTEEDAGAVSSALSTIGDNADAISEKAGPILGAVITGVTALLSRASEQAQEWADALRAGGDAAEEARGQLSNFWAANEQTNSMDSFGGWVSNLSGLGTQYGVTAMAIDQTNEALKAQWEAMTPLQQAQSKVAEWTATLASRMREEGASSEGVEAAKRRLAHWSEEQAKAQAVQNAAVAQFVPAADAAKAAMDDLTNAIALQDPNMAAEALNRYRVESAQAARDQNNLEMAINGVTKALNDQADAAQSRVDSSFAQQHALDSLEDAQKAYNDAVAKSGASSEEATRALLAVREGYNQVAEAAGRVASDALPAALDANQKKIISDKAQLDSLNALHEKYGDLGPDLEQQRASLAAIVGQANGATLAQAELAAAVGELGFAVTSLPDGKSIQIDAPTDDLVKKIQDLGFTVTTLPNGQVMVSADTDEAKANLGNLSVLLTGYQNTNPSTIVSADPRPANGVFGQLFSTINTLAGQRPTPVVGADPGPANGVFGQLFSTISTLAAQRPTPVVSANGGPANGVFGQLFSTISTLAAQRPTPVVSASDNASWTLGNIISKLSQIQSKTVTVTTVSMSKIQQSGGGSVSDAIKRAATGRVVGPGSGTSDSVPAVGPDGTPWALSNGEWVIREAAVRSLERRYGTAAMPTINSGQLPVATSTGSSGPLVKTQGGVVPQTIIQGGLTLSFPNVTTIADPDLPRQLLEAIEQGLIKLKREKG